MLRLYPDIHPYAEHRLTVDAPHEIFIEECGNPQGLPVVFLHGGPGAGCEPYHRCFFDPSRYRIVLFDQRGAGRSTPHASLERNTTPQLIADVEAIRQYLGIDRWVVFGGSWGSTLGLAYAEAHPARVIALVLRGIFLCRPWEIRWFYQSAPEADPSPAEDLPPAGFSCSPNERLVLTLPANTARVRLALQRLARSQRAVPPGGRAETHQRHSTADEARRR